MCVCARWSVLGPGNALRSVATTWPGPGSRALLIFSQCQDIGARGEVSRESSVMQAKNQKYSYISLCSALLIGLVKLGLKVLVSNVKTISQINWLVTPPTRDLSSKSGDNWDQWFLSTENWLLSFCLVIKYSHGKIWLELVYNGIHILVCCMISEINWKDRSYE